MIETREFYDRLTENGADFFAGVPDSLLANFCACVTENTSPDRHVITANEGNAVALCAGYHLSTGKVGVCYMQNSGEGNAVNPLLSLVDEDVYSIPLLLLIGWRGEPSKHDEPQHVKQGKLTCSLLDTMGICYEVLDDTYGEQLSRAFAYMAEYKKPYALVVKKGTFSSYAFKAASSDCVLTREGALQIILNNLGKNDVVVSTTGKTSREIFEIRERNGQGHAADFLTVGSMGHTASIAYGVSLGTDKTVWCIDGDGSFLMHMGSMAVLGTRLRENFKYILNDNHAHESVGGQPTCAGELDIPMILKGCGFEEVVVASNEKELSEGVARMKGEGKIALIVRTKQGSREDLGRPTTTPQENKRAFMRNLRHQA